MEEDDSDASSPTSNMPSIRKIEADSLDAGLFEPSLLNSGGLFTALTIVKRTLRTTPSIVVETLLENRNLFEYIFSELEDADAHIVIEFLIEAFPFKSEGFRDSLSTRVLHRIAEFLFLLSIDFEDAEMPTHTSRNFAKVNAATRVLDTLSVFTFSVAEDISEEEDEFFSANSRKNSKMYRRQRRHRQSRQSISFDPTLLKAFDESVPTCQEEAVLLTSKLLSELILILQTCLSDLRSSGLAGLIRRRYMRTEKTVAVANTDAKQSQSVASSQPVTVTATPLSKSASAYLDVQPLRASLYFDSVQHFGEWRIFISTKAEKHLRERRKNRPTFEIIIKKIKELSRGHFSFDNQKRLSGPDKGIPIFEAKLSADLRLVYQIDCISDYESEVERQVIKVYGIFTHAQMNKHLWNYLSTHLESKGAEYRHRVIHRNKPEVTGDNVFLPASWPPVQKDADAETSLVAISADANGLQDIHQWMVLEKYVAFTHTLFRCILADQEVSHVFNVSPYEREIIEHDSSCFVLGRSGTGKTTTMLFKIFGIERAVKAQIRQKLLSKPLRQLFVTQSGVLAGRVEDYYKKLSDFLQTAYMTDDELRARHRSKKSGENVAGLAMVDHDEEEWHEDLPSKFSELEDRHFPLFLTFDKLCKMIEVDLGLSFARQQYTKEHKRAQKCFKISNVPVSEDLADDDETGVVVGAASDSLLLPINTIGSNDEGLSSFLRVVTYDIFRHDYWPHLPQNLTKNLDPALVFSEFMGVIKGSEQSLYTTKGYLSRDEYVELSHRTQSAFAMSRMEMYDLFEAYQRRKFSQRDYDAPDRTHAIIQEMRRSKRISQKVDFLYVDEAQDNLLVDARLLRLLCSNPHGLFWAGDTAQTIAIGSSFRFNDLKAFLHRVEELVETQPVKPSSFQLTMNYRSHGGIVSCADSVIQLITKFWPYSIDILRREKGAVEGTKPIFFVGWEEDSLRYKQFLSDDSGNAVEFGAQQCILVRNDAARDLLRKQVGEIGVILTLYESKGLEFDDVLLYNFFNDSTCDVSQWRIVLNAIEVEARRGLSVPHFNDLRHAGICTELKFLYVAITRARKNLWIVDKSNKGTAMRIFFETNNLVQVCTPEQTPALAVSSSPDEWAKMGRSLFFNKQYSQAMHCFERAGSDMDRSIAYAYYLRQQARTLDKNTSKGFARRKQAFSSAAEAFVICAQGSERANDSYWRIAGECFVEVEDHRRAAEAYFEAEFYTEAAKLFKKAGLYDEAVRVVQEKKEYIDESVSDNILDVSRLHYLRLQKFEKVISLFESTEEGLSFIEDFGTNASRAQILERLGRYEEAAEIVFAEGSIDDTVRLFQAANNARASNRAVESVLNRLWDTFSFGAPIGRCEEATILLNLCAKFNRSHLSSVLGDQLSMFDAINNSEPVTLASLCGRFHDQHNHIEATILCLDQRLQRLQKSDMDTPQRASGIFSFFLLLVELIRTHVWNNKDCLKTEAIRKLLGVQEHAERGHQFVLLENSMISKFRLDARRFCTSPEAGQIMDQDSVMQWIKDALRNHINGITQAVTRVCERSKAFITPCLNHSANGSCFTVGCEREHVNPLKIQANWFMDRLDIHLKMVACLQAVDFALESGERELFHGNWLERISQLMFPARHTLGNAGIAASSCTPEQRRTLGTVHSWVFERALSLDPIKSPRNFLDSVSQMMNFSFWFSKPSTNDFIWRVPFLSHEKYRTTYGLSEKGFYSPPNLVSAIGLTDGSSILHGIIFLRFMMDAKSRSSMSIFHLTEIVENLCGAVALLETFRRNGLHGLMLPRSWMLLLLRKIDLGRPYDSRCRREILSVTERLVSILLREDSYKDLPHIGNASNAMRAICVNRLCRSVVLLAYNIPDKNFRYAVSHMLRKMKVQQKHVHHLNKEFFPDKQILWKTLSTTIRKSVMGSYLDEMVQLQRVGERPLTSFEGVRQVKMNGPADAVTALSLGYGTSTLSATAASFVPQNIPSTGPLGSSGNADIEPSSQEDALAEEAEVDEGVDDVEIPTESGEVEPSDDREMTKEDMAPVVTLEATTEELNAVALIRDTYKSYKNKRQLAMNDSAQSKRVREYFATCLHSVGDGWPSRYHKFIFLGILPHILACLDQIVQQATAGRSKAQRQMAQAHATDTTVDYDSFLERIGKFTSIQRTSIKMRKELQPASLSATLHSERPFDFKKVVLDLQTLSTSLGVEDDIDPAEGDLKLVTKAILQVAKCPALKPSKPSLNVEDIFDE